MEYEVIHEGGYKYIQTSKEGEVLLLLHGLFGALSNFADLVEELRPKYRIILPLLPIYDLPLFQVSVAGLVDFVESFTNHLNLNKIHVLGNSLGGHVAVLFAIKSQHKIRSMTLTGSSGLFESSLGSTFPRRGDYEYIKKKTQDTFFDPNVASKELVDEVFEIVNDRSKGIRIIYTAKSAVRHNLEKDLYQIHSPTLLIWGMNDTITPHFVGNKFNDLIKGSELFFLDKCGHAPMMELPKEFCEILVPFLEKHKI